MKLYLTQTQIAKIKRCARTRKLCKLRIDLNKKPNRNVPNLTQKQLYLLQEARRLKRKVFDIILTPEQVGGILPFPGLLTAAGKALAVRAASKLISKIRKKTKKKGLGVFL